MIKVKTFIVNSGNPLHHSRLDDSINSFIEENKVEVLDVKYSTCYSTQNYFTASALLVYKKTE